MNEPQQHAINLLESQGYELERASLWPVYRNPDTGIAAQVSLDGRIIPRGLKIKVKRS